MNKHDGKGNNNKKKSQRVSGLRAMHSFKVSYDGGGPERCCRNVLQMARCRLASPGRDDTLCSLPFHVHPQLCPVLMVYTDYHYYRDIFLIACAVVRLEGSCEEVAGAPAALYNQPLTDCWPQRRLTDIYWLFTFSPTLLLKYIHIFIINHTLLLILPWRFFSGSICNSSWAIWTMLEEVRFVPPGFLVITHGAVFVWKVSVIGESLGRSVEWGAKAEWSGLLKFKANKTNR